MGCIEIILPFPPSVNGLYGGGSGQQRFMSKKYKAWLQSCPPLDERIDGPVHIHYRFFWPDARIRDGQSYFKAVTDYLVKEKVIPDDNWKIVDSECWSHGGIDRKIPRVEISIKKVALHDMPSQ
jgi:Holliday junction resolvase RusA-like endonuclease